MVHGAFVPSQRRPLQLTQIGWFCCIYTVAANCFCCSSASADRAVVPDRRYCVCLLALLLVFLLLVLSALQSLRCLPPTAVALILMFSRVPRLPALVMPADGSMRFVLMNICLTAVLLLWCLLRRQSCQQMVHGGLAAQ
jgi:hypothetical protein